MRWAQVSSHCSVHGQAGLPRQTCLEAKLATSLDSSNLAGRFADAFEHAALSVVAVVTGDPTFRTRGNHVMDLLGTLLVETRLELLDLQGVGVLRS